MILDQTQIYQMFAMRYVPLITEKLVMTLDNGNVENTIAVRMPNSQKVARTDWTDYIVSVDEIEKKTGLDFFSTIPDQIARKIESKNYTFVIEP